MTLLEEWMGLEDISRAHWSAACCAGGELLVEREVVGDLRVRVYSVLDFETTICRRLACRAHCVP
jgi:hypothetical protein